MITFINVCNFYRRMQKKVKAKKTAKKNKKSEHAKTPKEHREQHGPDVKRLLEEYEKKESALDEDEDFVSSEQFDMNKDEGEF